MKLLVRIKLLDDKITEYVCVDFPYNSGAFIVLQMEGFKCEWIKESTVLSIETSFIL